MAADLCRKWFSLGNFLKILLQLERGGRDRAREARRGLLQSALFLTLDALLDSSHDGVLIGVGGDLGVWRALPRQVCYSAHYPEQRALLYLRAIGCTYQCSTIMYRTFGDHL